MTGPDRTRIAAGKGRAPGSWMARRECDYKAHGVRIARFLGELKSGRLHGPV